MSVPPPLPFVYYEWTITADGDDFVCCRGFSTLRHITDYRNANPTPHTVFLFGMIIVSPADVAKISSVNRRTPTSLVPIAISELPRMVGRSASIARLLECVPLLRYTAAWRQGQEGAEVTFVV